MVLIDLNNLRYSNRWVDDNEWDTKENLQRFSEGERIEGFTHSVPDGECFPMIQNGRLSVGYLYHNEN